MTGLIGVDAYDGRVNIWWDKSSAEDFDHYNVYLSQSETTDVTGMAPAYQVKDVSATSYQAVGLKDGVKYYFAVTAVDKTGNENKRVACVNVTPTPMPRGTADPGISVDVYKSDKAWPGTTLLPFNYTQGKPRIIEINMLGEIIWEYQLPRGMLFDVELLPNNNILFTFPMREYTRLIAREKLSGHTLIRRYLMMPTVCPMAILSLSGAGMQ